MDYNNRVLSFVLAKPNPVISCICIIFCICNRSSSYIFATEHHLLYLQNTILSFPAFAQSCVFATDHHLLYWQNSTLSTHIFPLPTFPRLICNDHERGKSEKPSETFLPQMAISDLNCSSAIDQHLDFSIPRPSPSTPLGLMALDSCGDGPRPTEQTVQCIVHSATMQDPQSPRPPEQ